MKDPDNQEESFYDEFDTRLEYYSKFLEDGDFEYWEPICFMDRNTPEFRRKLMRALWIINRFTEWKGTNWKQLNMKIKALQPYILKDIEYGWKDL